MADQASTRAVLDGLTTLILQSLQIMEGERHFPSSAGPDQMDDKIKRHAQRAELLRRIREEFENEMAKPI